MSKQLSKEIANQYENNDFADPQTEVVAPEGLVQPIEHLSIHRDGLKCNYCHFICRSKDWIQRHQREVHNIKIGRGRRRTVPVEWTTVWCQQFFTGVGRHFFEVRQTNQESTSVPTETTTRLLQLVHRQLDQKDRTVEEKKQAIRDSDDATEVSSWLDRTQWIRHLEGQDRAVVIQLVSPAKEDEELELRYVEKSLERLVEKARQTILQKKVSTFTLHRVQNFHAGEDSHKPFHVNLSQDTIERYRRVWSRLLIYVLRTARQETQLYQLTEHQRQGIADVLLAADRAVQFDGEDLEEAEEELINEELDWKCLQLCIVLLDHKLNHDEYESAAISYIAIAGLEYIPGTQPSQYKFKDASQYTPTLSGFIKVAQMLTIQYCLEKEMRGEVESCRELLEELHTRYLVVSTATPMDWALRLRLYGRAIHNKTTAVGGINWNGETVIYRETELSMIDFRRMVHHLCDETRHVLITDLLFAQGKEGDLPSYCWSELKDNPAKDDPGWYFVRDRRNCMQEGTRWLLNRILTTSELAVQFIHVEQGVWRQKRVNDYMDKISLFMEKLMVLIHITAGQPSRSSELLSLRYCNTEKGGHRCIFIENELMVIVTFYDKGYSIRGTEKIIHRYLPQEVGELLLLYIWLVLPLRQQLQQLVFNDNEIPTAFLWSIDRQKKWTRERVKTVLKRESDRLIGVPLNMASYRHIAIAISNRYMKRTKFEKDDDNKDQDEQHDEAIDKQSSHTSETAGSIYARHIEEAPTHTQQMRYRFRVSSLEWHEVLQFAGQLRGLKLLGQKRLQEDEHERSPGPRFRRWQTLRQTNLQEALQRLMGLETQFRGKQHTALEAIMANKSPIILVMRTGGGKSLMFILPASIREAGTTVVVTPLIALKQDMQRRCRELGLDCIAWSARKKIHDTCILLVTPESAVSQGFMNHLRKLQAMDRLDRIVIDECHVLLNTRLDFRRKLQKLRKMVEFTVQLVLLTATLPPSKEAELLSMISIEAPLMFRDMTSRHNIIYTVQQHDTKDIEQQVKVIISDRLQQYVEDNSRIIVYGGQVENCKQLAEKLDCEAYYADSEDKTSALQNWLDGKKQVIVATNALGLGIDVPNVRLVLHAEPSFDLLNYAQESGRAGRDGKPSEAIVLISKGRTSSKFKNMDERLLWEYLTTDNCRRVKLDQYLDGNLATESCTEDQEACDNCRQSRTQSLEPTAAEEDDTYDVVEEEMLGKKPCYRTANAELTGYKGGVVERGDRTANAELSGYKEEAVGPRNRTVNAELSGYKGEAVGPRDRMANAELAEYEEQEKQRRQQQSQYRQSRIAAATKVFSLEEKLQQANGRCIYCYYYGRETDHSFADCEKGEDSYNVYKSVKQSIRYARYSACWGCGCPQWVCKEFLPGGSRMCSFTEVLLPAAVVVMTDGRPGGGLAKVEKKINQVFESGSEATKWLGEMCGIERKQASNAAMVFLEFYIS
jgi:superfamily II DNA helicase RecQ